MDILWRAAAMKISYLYTRLLSARVARLNKSTDPSTIASARLIRSNIMRADIIPRMPFLAFHTDIRPNAVSGLSYIIAVVCTSLMKAAVALPVDADQSHVTRLGADNRPSGGVPVE